MSRLFLVARAALLCAFLFVTNNALATQVQLLTPGQMGAESDLVVRGKVGAIRSFWNDRHTRILTEVEIQVDERYKGNAGSRVNVIQVGGVVDGVRMTAHGLPSWNQDDEVLVFLEASLPGQFRVSGFSQGKFSVERDEETGAMFVRRSALGLERVDAFGKRVSSDGSLRVPMTELLREALPGSPSIGEGR